MKALVDIGYKRMEAAGYRQNPPSRRPRPAGVFLLRWPLPVLLMSDWTGRY